MDVSEIVGSSVDALGGERGVLRSTVDWAAALAREGKAPFVGVVARDAVVIGAGMNAVAEEADPTAHGEVSALRDATRRSGSLDLSGAVVYSNAEPCALCMLAAAVSGVGEMVYAAGRELVPREMDPNLDRTARLIDAVGAELAMGTRCGDTGLTFEELRAPFRTFLSIAGR
jgi:tRNA(Arg) A34 adenosine deaminase TadA